MELTSIFVDIHSKETLENGVYEVISLLRPKWIPRSALIHKTFSGGLTNKLVGVYIDGRKDEMVLIRIYGQNSDLMIDREKEIRNMKILHENGCGAELYAIFQNGIAYQYLSGSILSVESVREPNVYPAVATACAKMHSIKPPLNKEGASSEKEACLWKLLRKFQSLSPEGLQEDPKRNEHFKRVIPFTKYELAEEIEKMKTLLEKKVSERAKIRLCHNDLMPTNILINNDIKNVGDVLSASFIDYEYGDWNYREYDIANHFNEFVGLPDENTGEMNYEKYYPSKEFQLKWLREYLKNINTITSGSNVEPSQNEIEELYDLVSYFTPLCHLVWGIWSLVQSKYSDIDFDYINYAAQRLKQYKADSRKLF